MLALACLTWLPYRLGLWSAGAAAPMAETLFTLVFVASAIFLAAGALSDDRPSAWGRIGLALAPLLLAMVLRRWFPMLGPAYLAVPLAAALVLAAQARARWRGLDARGPAAGLSAR